MVFESRQIVNGNHLRDFVGKNVSILLQIQECSGQNLVGKSTDSKTVNVKLLDSSVNARPLDWVEIIGVPASHDAIKAKEVIQFEGGEQEFDVDAHNMVVTYFNHCKDFYRTQG